ncbi:MAG: cupredoxin domain-containing protein [Candidatus Omnitrophota bacterium]
MSRICLGIVVFLCLFSPLARAAEPEVFLLTIKDHRFEPAEISIPAGRKVKVRIENQDPTPEEFESTPLNREKLVGGGKSIIIYLGPLGPGSYPFYGEFHRQTAQGSVVVK